MKTAKAIFFVWIEGEIIPSENASRDLAMLNMFKIDMGALKFNYYPSDQTFSIVVEQLATNEFSAIGDAQNRIIDYQNKNAYCDSLTVYKYQRY